MLDRIYHNKATISIIVPAYNEELNIYNLLTTLLKINNFDELICVNDGSTDLTLEKIKKIRHEKFVLINFSKNKGKGSAIAEGILKAKGDIVVFIDADLKNFKKKHLENLVNPLKNKDFDATVGYPIGNIFDLFFIPLSGIRGYFRKDIISFVDEMKGKGYGIELFLNYKFKGKKVFFFPLKGVIHLYKYEKQNYKDVIFLTLKEIKDILKEILNQSNSFEYFFYSYFYPFYGRKIQVQSAKIKKLTVNLFCSLKNFFYKIIKNNKVKD